jgi:FMN-dependent NADH-azoreductase
MRQILMIKASPRGKASASGAVADTLATRLHDQQHRADLLQPGNDPHLR